MQEKFKVFKAITVYRIVYRVDKDKIIVVIIGVGMRREGDRQDIYTILDKELKE